MASKRNNRQPRRSPGPARQAAAEAELSPAINPKELRQDPDDLQTYTFQALTQKYRDMYDLDEIQTYWRINCRIMDSIVEPTEDPAVPKTPTIETSSAPTSDAVLPADASNSPSEDTFISCDPEPAKAGTVQKVKLFAVSKKDNVLQLVGSAGDKIVFLKTRVQGVASEAYGKLDAAVLPMKTRVSATITKANSSLQTRTVFIKDGYLYVSSAVGSKTSFIKSKITEKVTKPIGAYALAVRESAKRRMDPALQRVHPYYIRGYDNIAQIVGNCSNKVLAAKTFTAAQVDQLYIRVSDGAVHIKGVIAGRVVAIRKSISELTSAAVHRTSAQLKSMRDATAELTSKFVELVSNIYGKSKDKAQLLFSTIKEKCLTLVCKVSNGLVVIKMKLVDVAQLLQSKAFALKDNMLEAAKATKTKALESGAKVRVLAGNPDAQAAAAGAVALGASGGATGFIAGGAIGVACAVPAAFFTFGLSLPVGAAIGASSGACIGSSTGFVAGGVAGYKAHKEKETIGRTVGSAVDKVKAGKDKVFDSASTLRSSAFAKASAGKDKVFGSASNLRAMIRGDIGGTALA